MIMLNVSPKLSQLIFNDEILFIVTDLSAHKPSSIYPKIIPFGFGTTGSLVIPRSDLQNFRTLFIETHSVYNYQITTLQIFELLEKRYNFGKDGEPLTCRWENSMDHILYNRNGLDNSDRKILLPESWVRDAHACYQYQTRLDAYQKQTTGSNLRKSVDSFGFNFEKFPEK